jgi:hypothetical protein
MSELAIPLTEQECMVWLETQGVPGHFCAQVLNSLKLQRDRALAKCAERKTVHEWLNDLGIARQESGKPLCLLRRLAITTERLRELEQVIQLAVEQEDDYARINHLAHPHWFEQARRLLAVVPGARRG